MKKFISVFFLVMLLTGVVGIPVASAAHEVFHDQGQELQDLNKAQVFAKLAIAANWVFTALLVLSVFIIFTAAFQFVTGGSDAAALTGARAKLIWAVVGIGLALLARAIPSVVVDILN
jgi:hypothetical protein